MELTGVSHVNCKDTCESNNCNVGRTTKTLQCHSCSASRDSSGYPVGLGDQNCFDHPENTPLIDCPIEYDFCETEMLVDWFMKGDQQVRITRGCAKYEQSKECTSGQSERVMFKDCFEDCDTPGCNDKNTIGSKFDEGYNQESCYACQYAEQDNGDVIGNTNCLGQPNDADKTR